MTPEEADTGRVHLRGVTLAWSETGTGPTVIWLHGLGSSAWGPERSGRTGWHPVTTAGYRLVRYDARGHGRSSGTADATTYTWTSLADDLLALLDKVAPGRPVAGIGESMGTATLLHAALRAPDRFTRLALTAPPTAWATRATQAHAYEEMARLVEQRGRAPLDEMWTTGPAPAPLDGLARLPADVAEALLPAVLLGAAASDLPPRADIARFGVPTLILAWADDPGHPVSTADALAALIPAADIEVAASRGELESWGSRVAAFLAPVRSPG